MLTSTVIWPSERTGEKVDREEGGGGKKRESDTQPNDNYKHGRKALFHLYKTADFSGIAFRFRGPNQTCVI